MNLIRALELHKTACYAAAQKSSDVAFKWAMEIQAATNQYKICTLKEKAPDLGGARA